MGEGKSATDKAKINKERMRIPLNIFNCPTRRTGGPYPNPGNIYYKNAENPLTELARTDYAASSGDQSTNEFGGGPNSIAHGDTTFVWPKLEGYTGIVFVRSEVRVAHITRGTSNTFLFGEKYLNPSNYITGSDPGDNESMYVGMDNDTNRVTFSPPMQDQPGIASTTQFGGPHSGGLEMAYCDASVQFVSYGIDPQIFKRSGNRR